MLQYFNFSIQLNAILTLGQNGYGATVMALVQQAKDAEKFAQERFVSLVQKGILTYAGKSTAGE